MSKHNQLRNSLETCINGRSCTNCAYVSSCCYSDDSSRCISTDILKDSLSAINKYSQCIDTLYTELCAYRSICNDQCNQIMNLYNAIKSVNDKYSKYMSDIIDTESSAPIKTGTDQNGIEHINLNIYWYALTEDEQQTLHALLSKAHIGYCHEDVN